MDIYVFNIRSHKLFMITNRIKRIHVLFLCAYAINAKLYYRENT